MPACPSHRTRTGCRSRRSSRCPSSGCWDRRPWPTGCRSGSWVRPSRRSSTGSAAMPAWSASRPRPPACWPSHPARCCRSSPSPTTSHCSCSWARSRCGPAHAGCAVTVAPSCSAGSSSAWRPCRATTACCWASPSSWPSWSSAGGRCGPVGRTGSAWSPPCGPRAASAGRRRWAASGCSCSSWRPGICARRWSSAASRRPRRAAASSGSPTTPSSGASPARRRRRPSWPRASGRCWPAGWPG